MGGVQNNLGKKIGTLKTGGGKIDSLAGIYTPGKKRMAFNRCYTRYFGFRSLINFKSHFSSKSGQK